MYIKYSAIKIKGIYPFLFILILLTAACAGAPEREPAREAVIMKSKDKMEAPAVIEAEPEPMKGPVEYEIAEEAFSEPSLAPPVKADVYESKIAERAIKKETLPREAKTGEELSVTGKNLSDGDKSFFGIMGATAPPDEGVLAPKKKDIPGKRKIPKASGLRAGYADDNKQFNYFINFLEKYGPQAPHYTRDVRERIVLKVKDKEGKSLSNAQVKIYSGKNLLFRGLTYSDGSFLFFPSEYDNNITEFRVEASLNRSRKELTVDRQGKREIEVRLDSRRRVAQQVPLDILFILDTTGSMGEEIHRLKTTIEMINLNLTSLSSQPKVRFGMVLYKDKKDAYVTKTVPLTESLDEFRSALDKVRASGGGDHPEDLQSALMASMKGIKWNNDGIRLSFIITDAPPHLDYGQEYSYLNAMSDARRKGIKIFSVGTGGLNIMGEYILRQIAQYTSGRYIFLTYGERGESDGGRPGSVSHHTGSNFETDKLEAIIIRFAKEELRNLTGDEIEEADEYFEATRIADEEKGDTLKKLFDMAVSQLIDYSALSISPDTPVALFPFSMKDKSLAGNAEYLGEQLLFSLSTNKSFKVLERKDIQAVIDETKFQLSGFVPEKEAVEAGKLAGAKIIIRGNIYSGKKNYEIFLKLLRVETGEVLSVTKLVVSRKLGLE
ncbi:MAG: VWA domain-containing protein [Deltaproteobacteria bacterium]|nr:VWA domain-containing protein [Deltaproteobacteria bacterium]